MSQRREGQGRTKDIEWSRRQEDSEQSRRHEDRERRQQDRQRRRADRTRQSDSIVSSDGSLNRRRVHEIATPALDRWRSGAELFAVRRRLRSVFGAGMLIIAIQLLVAPDGITGMLITLWFLLSLPVVAVAGCLLVLLRNPIDAPSVWWDNSILATIGLLSLASLVRAGQANPAGRVLWSILIGDDHPTAEYYHFGEDDAVDVSAVSRIRRYVWYAVIGSAAIILIDQAIRNDPFESGLFEGLLGTDPGGAESLMLAILAAVFGLGLGLFMAAIDR